MEKSNPKQPRLVKKRNWLSNFNCTKNDLASWYFDLMIFFMHSPRERKTETQPLLNKTQKWNSLWQVAQIMKQQSHPTPSHCHHFLIFCMLVLYCIEQDPHPLKRHTYVSKVCRTVSQKSFRSDAFWQMWRKPFIAFFSISAQSTS